MSNPFYKQNGIGQRPNNFLQFMSMMRGKNSNDILNNLVSSGKISQEQLNVVQQRAKQMNGLFEQFRSMLGY